MKTLILLALSLYIQAETHYDEAKVPAYKLPAFNAKSVKNWENSRRQEIFELFRNEMFGTFPGKPQNMTSKVYSDELVFDGKARMKQVRITITRLKKSVTVDLLFFHPVKKVSPVVVALNFRGNHSVISHKGITFNNRTKNDPRGSRSEFWEARYLIEQGYALATFQRGDIDPDHDDGYKNGVHALYPELTKPNNNFSTISAWAWGLRRVIDYIETQPFIDNKRIIAFGHSRLGKTALWAGAQDKRIAMIVSNNSGSGGSALSKREFGERIIDLNTRFPHWFSRNFRKYNNNEKSLSFDQHMLIALSAPRPVYITSASEDLWADPKGEFLSAKAASEIYELYGLKGLTLDKFPKANHSSSSQGMIGYHLRKGKHAVTPYDWQRIIPFATKHLSSKKK